MTNTMIPYRAPTASFLLLCLTMGCGSNSDASKAGSGGSTSSGGSATGGTLASDVGGAVQGTAGAAAQVGGNSSGATSSTSSSAGGTSLGGNATSSTVAGGATSTGGRLMPTAGTATDSGTCSGHADTVLSLVGWAAPTTGGKGGPRVEVATGTALQAALKAHQKATTPLTIVVTGTITPENSLDADGITPLAKIDAKDLKNLSIIGAGAAAEFNGIGLKLWRVSNVVVRNLKIHHVLVGDKDAISIEGPADHIWIDHCELYNTYQGVDKDYYDALLDAKAESAYLTYSWNYLHDSWKMSLVGFTEADTFDRKLTMHHNYIKNVNSRTPLVRGSSVHIFNNYFQDVLDTGINSRVGACVQIEQNYFSNVMDPWVSAFSGPTGLGGAELICNVLADGTKSVFNASSDIYQVLPCTLDVPYDYSAVLNVVEQVPAIVTANAGTGKLADEESY